MYNRNVRQIKAQRNAEFFAHHFQSEAGPKFRRTEVVLRKWRWGCSSEVSDVESGMDDNAATSANRDERHSQYMERTLSMYEKQAHEQFIRIKSPDRKEYERDLVHKGQHVCRKEG